MTDASCAPLESRDNRLHPCEEDPLCFHAISHLVSDPLLLAHCKSGLLNLIPHLHIKGPLLALAAKPSQLLPSHFSHKTINLRNIKIFDYIFTLKIACHVLINESNEDVLASDDRYRWGLMILFRAESDRHKSNHMKLCIIKAIFV